MATRATLRASDADREQVAERLRRATTEGRLAADELEQRLEAALSARTYGQLDALVADLPGASPPMRRELELGWVRHALALAIMVPVVIAVTVAVVFAFTGVFAAWALWLGVGWWFFGRRRRLYSASRGRSLHAGERGCGWHGSTAPTPPSRGSWV
jgi:hypothetical protein